MFSLWYVPGPVVGNYILLNVVSNMDGINYWRLQCHLFSGSTFRTITEAPLALLKSNQENTNDTLYPNEGGVKSGQVLSSFKKMTM